ncbi:hypothetical protein ACGFIK_08715 [Micromonospora sp. NPDC048871]|uniref:hypothetical protein n=1 Tax=Micromonospora sp. NPDC048871 TaxID=3364259 RepID=UPI00371EC8E6
MKRDQLFALALAGVTVFALTACGGEDTEAPATSASAPASASATPQTSAPAAAGEDDKKVCEAVQKAGDESKEVLFDALQAGKEPTAEMLSETYTDMAAALGKAAEAASTDSKVANAVKEFQAQVEEAAESSDPVAAGDAAAFQKTATNLTAVCKETGVDINF